MIYVIASIHIRKGRVAEFMKILKENIPNVLEEKGCVEYAATIDVATDLPPQEINENMVTIVEKWVSLEDLRAHLSAPHMLSYKDKVKDIVIKVVLKVLERA